MSLFIKDYIFQIILISTLFSSYFTVVQSCDFIGTLQECGYNYTGQNRTIYPDPAVSNLAGVTTLLPLIQGRLTGCSSNLQRFVCAALLPECGRWTGPCRSLCQVVKTDCQSRIDESLNIFLGLFNCERYANNTPCILPLSPSPSQTLSLPTSSSSSSTRSSTSPTPTSAPPITQTGNETGCPPSSLTYYTQSAKTFAKGWIATWSTVCFISTLLTLLTFIIKPSRFEYPWRPIVYLALCFNLHSLGYYFSLVLGRTIITCPGNMYLSSETSWGWEHAPCLINFGLLYYSMVAAFLWWLTLTISWFLSSVFKWSNEAVGRLAPFFHASAWVIPLLMMISLIAGQVVSADELTGTCFIVRDSTTPTLYALLIGVLIPLMLFVCIGMLFLSIGLVSVLKVRAFLHRKGRQRESIVLEKLVIRVGVFVGVYVIPAGVVIGCYFYELVATPNWLTINGLETCNSNGGGSCKGGDPVIPMVRIFMFLIIGSLTGIWIWSKKTLETWRDLFKRCQCCVSSSNTASPENDKPQAYSLDFNS